MTKRVPLREDCTCQGATLSAGESVVRNVKFLGFKSRNRRRYLPEAVDDALHLYNGMVVNINHPADGAGQPRSVLDRFGRLSNPRRGDDGAYADMSYNPKHPFAEVFRWYVQNDPAAVGLSHNAVGSGRQDGGEFLVEKIHEVRSVDLVADPATTKSLFESMDYDDPLMAGMNGDDAMPEETPGHEDHLVDAVGALLKDSDISPEAKKKKILAIMKILHDEGGMVEEPMGDDAAAKEEGDAGDEDDGGKEKKDEEESLEDLPVEAQNKRLREQLDMFKAREARARRLDYVRGLANSAGLAKELVTAVFVEQLADANSDRKIRELIDDRRLASAVRKPVSAGKGFKKPISDQEFKEQLTGA
jgi:hypothetical protein